MDQLVSAVNDLITDHWVKFATAAGFTAIGWMIARWRNAAEWKQREFFHRINFSLNSIHEQTLRIRTLCEKSCADVFLNETAVRQLTAVAQQTTPGKPLIPLPKDDYWYFLNAVLNELSEQFADGLLAREAGKSVTSVQYVICLTNECDGDTRTRKIRALVTRRDLLTKLPDEKPKFESPHHHIRWETMLHLAEMYKKEPWQFLDVELVT
jgi:hypothetical protein